MTHLLSKHIKGLGMKFDHTVKYKGEYYPAGTEIPELDMNVTESEMEPTDLNMNEPGDETEITDLDMCKAEVGTKTSDAEDGMTEDVPKEAPPEKAQAKRGRKPAAGK